QRRLSAGYIVPIASHVVVTDNAWISRLLVAEHQVSSLLFSRLPKNHENHSFVTFVSYGIS
ncbi:MAG: hypothetical protein LBO00_03760, partial [Zoogloeaceae bacterium]|nr:hypothetical protein [Zoogloeaceae bacterium]